VNVFGPNLLPNISSFVDSFLLIFWDGWSICISRSSCYVYPTQA
jgi:hypothetical protein